MAIRNFEIKRDPFSGEINFWDANILVTQDAHSPFGEYVNKFCVYTAFDLYQTVKREDNSGDENLEVRLTLRTGVFERLCYQAIAKRNDNCLVIEEKQFDINEILQDRISTLYALKQKYKVDISLDIPIFCPDKNLFKQLIEKINRNYPQLKEIGVQFSSSEEKVDVNILCNSAQVPELQFDDDKECLYFIVDNQESILREDDADIIYWHLTENNFYDTIKSYIEYLYIYKYVVKLSNELKKNYNQQLTPEEKFTLYKIDKVDNLLYLSFYSDKIDIERNENLCIGELKMLLPDCFPDKLDFERLNGSIEKQESPASVIYYTWNGEKGNLKLNYDTSVLEIQEVSVQKRNIILTAVDVGKTTISIYSHNSCFLDEKEVCVWKKEKVSNIIVYDKRSEKYQADEIDESSEEYQESADEIDESSEEYQEGADEIDESSEEYQEDISFVCEEDSRIGVLLKCATGLTLDNLGKSCWKIKTSFNESIEVDDTNYDSETGYIRASIDLSKPGRWEVVFEHERIEKTLFVFDIKPKVTGADISLEEINNTSQTVKINTDTLSPSFELDTICGSSWILKLRLGPQNTYYEFECQNNGFPYGIYAAPEICSSQNFEVERLSLFEFKINWKKLGKSELIIKNVPISDRNQIAILVNIKKDPAILNTMIRYELGAIVGAVLAVLILFDCFASEPEKNSEWTLFLGQFFVLNSVNNILEIGIVSFDIFACWRVRSLEERVFEEDKKSIIRNIGIFLIISVLFFWIKFFIF